MAKLVMRSCWLGLLVVAGCGGVDMPTTSDAAMPGGDADSLHDAAPDGGRDAGPRDAAAAHDAYVAIDADMIDAAMPIDAHVVDAAMPPDAWITPNDAWVLQVDAAASVCGDGVVGPGETCDDGNAVTETCAYAVASCTVCDASCHSVAGSTSVCGDSAVDPTNETCDDGNTVTEVCAYGLASCSVCDMTCHSVAGATSFCGDGVVDAAHEACDDGNSASGDGCSACAVDTGYTCSGAPSACTCGGGTGYALCGGTCLDARTDVDNCGGCNVSCTSLEGCYASSCITILIAPSSGENGATYGPQPSDDGRFVVVHSHSTNFVAGDTNGFYDIYVRDIVQSTWERISLASDRVTQLNGDAINAFISGDGNVVVFQTAASNADPADTDTANDVYAYDRTTQVLTFLSNGTTVSSDFADNVRVSGDGRYAMFRTNAAGITGTSTRQVVYYDLTNGAREVVSLVDGSSTAMGNGESAFPISSADGRYVAFESSATNLVTGDTNGHWDIFVRDRVLGTTTLVSSGLGGAQGDGDARRPWISADARYVGFSSTSTNLVSGDTNATLDAFVFDRTNGTTIRVSLASDGSQVTTAAPIWTVQGISTTGRVTMATPAALIPTDIYTSSDIYVYDIATASIHMESTTPSGAPEGGVDDATSITPDGRYVFFQSNSSNGLLAGVAGANVYRRDLFARGL
jgi:cysteine-rich repeat protein